MKQLPEVELWHISGNVYDKNHTGYFSEYCWSSDGRYIVFSDTRLSSKILDFHKRVAIQLPGASLATWCVNENAAVFLLGSARREERKRL